MTSSQSRSNALWKVRLKKNNTSTGWRESTITIKLEDIPSVDHVWETYNHYLHCSRDSELRKFKSQSDSSVTSYMLNVHWTDPCHLSFNWMHECHWMMGRPTSSPLMQEIFHYGIQGDLGNTNDQGESGEKPYLELDFLEGSQMVRNWFIQCHVLFFFFFSIT